MFTSSNSSFTECVRKDSIVLSASRSNINRQVTGTVVSHQDIDLSIDSEDGPLYIFESCSFNNLINSGNGGAITCTGTVSNYFKPQLAIKESSFNSCKSTSGYGGGVCVAGLSLFIVDKAYFFNCNSTTQSGGGLTFSSSTCLPVISDTTFISCYARNYYSSADYADDGGGVSIGCSFPSTKLHYIIESCRFISCGCYDWGAGGNIAISSAVLGCADSLFSSCQCLLASALGISLETADADFLIRFCWFGYNTGTYMPSDIAFN